VLDRAGRPVHETAVPLPGPRLPHDMCFTEHFAILNDLPLFWDAAGLAKGSYRPRMHDLPSRFAILPRRGGAGEVRWFEAAPTYVLHWINAFEQGGEVILDGFFQHDPSPRPDPADGVWGPLKKMVDMGAMGTRPWRWRFDLRTGRTREEPLGDDCCEFPQVSGRIGGRPYRYAYTMTAKPGWFLFDGLLKLDLETGRTQRYRWPDGVFGSEAPMAPRPGATAEDDGWLVTFVSDTNTDTSECQLFDARNIAAGPICRLRLPERICAGVHACWAPASALGQPG
jgi:carotenoid cleavage dioxygenase-like enzyme